MGLRGRSYGLPNAERDKEQRSAIIVGRELSKLNIKIGDSRSASTAISLKNWRRRAMSGDPRSDLDAWVYNELRRSAFESSENPVLYGSPEISGHECAVDLRR